MRQFILPLCLLGTTALTLTAGPARRTVTTLTQPTGDTLQALFCGDEFGAYYLDAYGQRLHRDSLGYWRPMQAHEVALAHSQQLARRRQRAEDNAPAPDATTPTRADATRSKANLTLGEHRMLTLLVQFPDLPFTLGTQERFEEMLNGTDYTYQGATGSAQRYFRDNSQERFVPTFDVVGPVTLSHNYAYYGAHSSDGDVDVRPVEAIVEGIQLAIKQGLLKDLTPYDNDGDKYVDLVYVFYAGYSEASNAGDNYLWPHQWSVYNYNLKVGNIRFGKYACSSELNGTPQDANILLDGIGSCVHEFSHGLGLPDFYNTGSESGCYGMDHWSVMDQGAYNNDGLTPPNLTAHERNLLGWLDYTPLPTDADVVLPNIATDNVAYIYTNLQNPNETFIFENHQSSGWDAYYDYGNSYNQVALHGLLVTHLDYDQKVWSDNVVNNDPAHQRYAPVPADNLLYSYDNVTDNQTYTQFVRQFRNDIWPGYTIKNTSFGYNTSPASTFFTGDTAQFLISNIAEDAEGNVTFQVRSGSALTSGGDSNTSAITEVSDDLDGRFVDVYDLGGRRVLSGVEAQALSRLPLRAGYYMLHDGRTVRKVYVK